MSDSEKAFLEIENTFTFRRKIIHQIKKILKTFYFSNLRFKKLMIIKIGCSAVLEKKREKFIG